MKVLHFKTVYLNLSETFIDRLVRNHKQFEPVIATCYPKHYTSGINIHTMPTSSIKKIWNTLLLKLNRTPSFLFDVVKNKKLHLIHGHFGLDSYRLIHLKHSFDLPLVVNFYGYDVRRLPNEFGWKNRYKKLAKEGDLFIVGSEDMKANVIELGFPKEKIKVLKLGIDMDKIKFKQRLSAGPKLMAVGRLVEKKGFKYAVQAVGLLKKQGINTRLDIYGDGNLRNDLKNLIKELDLGGHITIHGQTKNETIIEELYRHDILLVPSVQARDGDREGIPQTTVEGMATGIPVIASNHAGLPELVIDKETGLQVPEGEAEALSKAIQLYLNNPDLISKVSKRARKRVKQEHSISAQVEKVENFYNSIL